MNQELVNEYFEHRDGRLYWKKVAHPNKQYLVGQEAGSIHQTGYRHVSWLGKVCKVHRLIFLVVNGYLPKEIDHINGNRQDNRVENLREVTRSQNQCNRGAISSNTSGYPCVSWHKATNAWLVRVMKDGKTYLVGYFKDLELAGLVAAEARAKYHGAYTHNSQL